MSQPRFVSPLSEEVRRQPDGLHRAGRSHRVRQHAHAVLLSAQGYALDQAADILHVDRDVISRTLDRWEAGGAAVLQEGSRPRRPSKMDAALATEECAAAQEPTQTEVCSGTAWPSMIEPPLGTVRSRPMGTGGKMRRPSSMQAFM